MRRELLRGGQLPPPPLRRSPAHPLLPRSHPPFTKPPLPPLKKSGTPLDSQLSLTLIPKVKACRLIEVAPKGQSLQAVWQCHTCQSLIEEVSKIQSLQAAWQRHTSQSLIKVEPEGQSLQAAWQHHTSQSLIEASPRGQCLQVVWQGHTWYTPIERPSQD